MSKMRVQISTAWHFKFSFGENRSFNSVIDIVRQILSIVLFDHHCLLFNIFRRKYCLCVKLCIGYCV